MPHKILSAVWFAWLGLVLLALALPAQPAIGLIVLLLFVPIEAVGVFRDTGSKDTLSEIATWLQRKLSKHQRPLRGWNALLMIVILCISGLLTRTFIAYSGITLLGLAVGALTVIWLSDHWLDPRAHG